MKITPTLKDIFEEILIAENMTEGQYNKIKHSRKARYILNIRQPMCFLAREYGYTLQKIGEFIGIKYSTVHHHCALATSYCSFDRVYKNRIDTIRDRINQKSERRSIFEVEGFVARDEKDNSLNFFYDNPIKCYDVWISDGKHIALPKYAYPHISFSDGPQACQFNLTLQGKDE